VGDDDPIRVVPAEQFLTPAGDPHPDVGVHVFTGDLHYLFSLDVGDPNQVRHGGQDFAHRQHGGLVTNGLGGRRRCPRDGAAGGQDHDPGFCRRLERHEGGDKEWNEDKKKCDHDNFTKNCIHGHFL